MVDDRDDDALMVAYRDGDTRAFRLLFERWASRIHRMLSRDLADADATDLTQATFLQVHRARRDFRTDGHLRPWLYTIALNLKREHFRRLGRRPVAVSLESEPGVASGGADARLEHRELRRALAELSDEQREAIVLHWFEGFSFREIASLVGVSESAVKVRAHRGYRRLKNRLGSDLQTVVTEEGAGAYSANRA